MINNLPLHAKFIPLFLCILGEFLYATPICLMIFPYLIKFSLQTSWNIFFTFLFKDELDLVVSATRYKLRIMSATEVQVQEISHDNAAEPVYALSNVSIFASYIDFFFATFACTTNFFTHNYLINTFCFGLRRVLPFFLLLNKIFSIS